MSIPEKRYRFFLKLYPARFREEYETVLEQQFRDEYRDVQGVWARFRFWILAIADLAVSVPVELAHELKQDVGYAFRAYRHRPALTALAFLALAFGIGATTGVFSVVNAVLLRSLPFRDAERLVRVENSSDSLKDSQVSHDALEGIAYYSTSEMNLSIMQGSARVNVTETSANYFSLLGSDPQIGRGFALDEEVAGRDSVAVIGNGLWQQLFGGNPQVLGSSIRLNGTPLTIIGVAPPGFDFPGKTSLWTPTTFHLGMLQKEGARVRTNIARLRTGLTLAQATQILESAEAHARSGQSASGGQAPVKLLPIRDILAGPVRKASLVLMGVACCVLLIACANIAHLLLSRTTERRHELGLRAALGASRARLVQQLITESTLLTLTASVAGLALAHWLARLASTAMPPQLSAQQYSVLDWRVFAFAAAAALMTGVAFGVMPVSLIGRLQPAGYSPRSQTGSTRSGVRRMRSGLVAMQAALTVVLLASATVMGYSFLKLMNADLGFHTGDIVTLKVSLAGTPQEAEISRRQYYHDALDRLRAIPGVRAAGAVSYLPLGRDSVFMILRFRFETRPEQGAMFNVVSPDYFRSMNTALIAGREFTAADQSSTAPAIIVNEAFAQRIGKTPAALIGKQLKVVGMDELRTIVGVVGTMRTSYSAELREPQAYWPIEQLTPMSATFVVRVSGDAQALIPVCRSVLQAVDRQVPVYDVMTLDARLQDVLAKPRFYTTSIVFLGGFALLLAVIGIFGASSHSIAQRTHEIGVSLAVGATPHRLRRKLLRQSMTPAIVGMLIGVAGAFALGRFLQSLIDNVEPMNASVCSIAAMVLVATSATAVWTATGRILRIDPMDVLRAE